MMTTIEQLIITLKMKMLHWQHCWTFERLRICVRIRETTVLVFILIDVACFSMFKAKLLESVAIFGLTACLSLLLLRYNLHTIKLSF